MEAVIEEPVVSRRFTSNVTWNLVGTGLPMLVAFVAVPPLVRTMGAARFGVLSLSWMVVGYFSLFDLGLGRAMTLLVAEKIGKRETAEIPALVWTSMALMLALGVVGAVALAASTPWLVGHALAIPAALRSETLLSFFILSVSIPIVIGTTGLRGLLEAHQRFDLVNFVRVPLGALTYLGPLAVLPFSHSLPAMVAVLVAARIVSLLVYVAICVKHYPDLARRETVAPELMKRLLTFGGWMTVSNIAAPLLLYLGRIMIAVLISAQAVAYFSTPYDVVINLLTIPSVYVGVLFPALTQLFHAAPEDVRPLYHRSLLIVGLVMLPLCAATFVLAKPGLAWWINAEFSVNGYRVAQLLAVGIFINSFGHLSQSLIQAAGRPDLTAKLHVVELCLYVPYSWWLIRTHGIEGAAVAWAVRVCISTCVLAILANRCMKTTEPKRAWVAANVS